MVFRSDTHYDKLNVVQNAPPEVIRAAYRALCQKYHPDRYCDVADGTRIMQEVNAAYVVLSDRALRREYDVYIVEQDAADATSAGDPVRGAESEPIWHAAPSRDPQYSGAGFRDSERFVRDGEYAHSAHATASFPKSHSAWRSRSMISRIQMVLTAISSASLALWFAVSNGSGTLLERAFGGGVIGLVIGLVLAGCIAGLLVDD